MQRCTFPTAIHAEVTQNNCILHNFFITELYKTTAPNCLIFESQVDFTDRLWIILDTEG